MVMCNEPETRTPLSGLGANGHEAGHFLLGDADLAATQIGERDVLDVEVLPGGAVAVHFGGLGYFGPAGRRKFYSRHSGVVMG
jgi:hypothetical protein